MKKIKVLIGFTKLPVPVKIAFYRNVLSRMRENVATFRNPDESLDGAATLIDLLEAKLLATTDGGRSTTLALRAAEEETDLIMKNLALYVDRIANGDESIIVLSGFEGSRQPASIRKEVLKASDGARSSIVKLLAKAVDDAGAYIWQMAKDTLPTTDAGWEIAGYSTQANFEIPDLAVGSIYYFRMAAITPDGVTDHTSPVMKIVV